MIGKFKTETRNYVLIDEFICLRSKAHSFNCGKSKNKLKGIPKCPIKNHKFDESYNCLFGGDYQKNIISRSSVRQTMICVFIKYVSLHYQLQMIKNVITKINNTESIPWEWIITIKWW